jgi:ligand-binding sensor domain-containing protein
VVTAAKGGVLRRHWFRCTGLCALAFLAATLPAIAAGFLKPAAEYLSHTFTTDDGLPTNIVNDVLQSQDGFLIVGGPAGLFRFDGQRFAEMKSDPPKEIVVHSLAAGADGDVWAGTESGFTGFDTRKSINERKLHRFITWGGANSIT